MATGLEVPTLNQLSLLPLSVGASYSAASIGNSGQYTTSSDFSVTSKKITINTSGLFLVSYTIGVYGYSSDSAPAHRINLSVSVNTSLGSIYTFSKTLSDETYQNFFNGYVYIVLNKNNTISFSTGEGSYDITVTAIKIA